MEIADKLKRNGGSRFTKNPSKLYLKAVRALEELEDKEHNADRAFADFESMRREKRWDEYFTLHPDPWLDVLVDTIKRDGDDIGTIYNDANTPMGFDHTAMWVSKSDAKTPCLFTQPYKLRFEDMFRIVDFCTRYGLRCDINALLSWHFPASSIGLLIQPAANSYVDFHNLGLAREI